MHQGCDNLNQYVAKYDEGDYKRNLAVRQVPFFASMGTGSQIRLKRVNFKIDSGKIRIFATK